MEKLKEEALAVNKILAKCESVWFFKIKLNTYQIFQFLRKYFFKIEKFDEQINKLVEYLKIDSDQYKLRESISQSLNHIFKQFWTENGILKIFEYGL
jgi:hypothetical protein